MNRDTSTAIWYRQLDPGCFTAPHPSADADNRPAMESSSVARPAPEAATYTSASIADHWPTPPADGEAWPARATATRL